MSLLAALAAHDLRFISTQRTDGQSRGHAFTTIEGMEGFDGHLFNWVRLADAGAACAARTSPRWTAAISRRRCITLASGLRQLPTEPEALLRIFRGARRSRFAAEARCEVGGSRRQTSRPGDQDLRHTFKSSRTHRASGSGTARRQARGTCRSIGELARAASQALDGAIRPTPHEAEIAVLDRAACVTTSRSGQATGFGRARTRWNGSRSRATGAGRRHELPPALRQATRPVVGRLSSDRCRGPRPPGSRRTTTCSPPRRGSPASSRSPRATCPRAHWFRLGRPVTSVQGRSHAVVVGRDDVRISDAAARDAELSGNTARRDVPDGRSAADPARRGTRRALGHVQNARYNVVDRHGTYQYRAFGVPGLGLRRGLGDDLVIAPYATALAAMVDPWRRPSNILRPARCRRSRWAASATTTPSDYTSRDDDADGRRAGLDRNPEERHRRSHVRWPIIRA